MWYKFTFKIFLIFARTTTQIGSHSSECWEIVISWIKRFPLWEKAEKRFLFFFKLVVTNTKILLKHDRKQPKDFMNESFAVLVSRTGNVEKTFRKHQSSWSKKQSWSPPHVKNRWERIYAAGLCWCWKRDIYFHEWIFSLAVTSLDFWHAMRRKNNQREWRKKKTVACIPRHGLSVGDYI